jgi:hypothetical protein
MQFWAITNGSSADRRTKGKQAKEKEKEKEGGGRRRNVLRRGVTTLSEKSKTISGRNQETATHFACCQLSGEDFAVKLLLIVKLEIGSPT